MWVGFVTFRFDGRAVVVAVGAVWGFPDDLQGDST